VGEGGIVKNTPSTVLLAGIGRGPFEAVAPVLDRRHLTVIHLESPEDAVALALEKSFDLLIFDAEPNQRTLADLVRALRAASSASCRSSLLVVADERTAQAARDLVGRGVNRVVTLGEPEEAIEQHVADLLDIAPRAAVRFTARLTTVLDDGTLEVVGRTANVSVTGMLLQANASLHPGQKVAFEFLAGNGNDMVSGQAEIVRCAVADHGGVNGIGIRFLDFDGNGRQRIEAVLNDALVKPLAESA
jgi:hypothetical protein